MNVVRHGRLFEKFKDEKVLKFDCDRCGCIFEEFKFKCYMDGFICCQCPECGVWVDRVEVYHEDN